MAAMASFLLRVIILFSAVTSCISTSSLPKTYGILLIPGFDVLDVFGPLSYINSLPDTTVHLIAESSLDPVYSHTLNATMSTIIYKNGQLVIPTHTIDTAPPLDVLIVVGGAGSRAILAGLLQPSVAFIRDRYPTLKYLLSICTGNALTATSGVIDGRLSTGNKRAWAFVTGQGPNVNWVPKARWVVDGNIWSSSGVESGTDMIYSFIKHVYTKPVAQSIANVLEHMPHTDPSFDPFADLYNTSGTLIPPPPTPPIPASAPSKFGVLIYPGFSTMEVWSVLDFINLAAITKNVSLIAADLNPVVADIAPGSISLPFFPKRGQPTLPKFTLENAPELDVLLVPGAPRIPRDPKLAAFIASKYPNLQYLISMGTGAALVAQSGISNGHEATTAKPFFNQVKQKYKGVSWKAKARWTVSDDGKLWSSSGGAAIMDTFYAFLGHAWSPEGANHTSINLEYVPNTDPSVDPFADTWGAR
ncbi:hypothetical protein FRC02_004835 [Tulasnella sp. 418]|nr:hypothetical protein FRC02_004835 [Tulasnella sp. 418]